MMKLLLVSTLCPAGFVLRAFAGGLDHDLISQVLAVHVYDAIGSRPILRPEAYTPAKIDRQLDDQARQFPGDPTRNR